MENCIKYLEIHKNKTNTSYVNKNKRRLKPFFKLICSYKEIKQAMLPLGMFIAKHMNAGESRRESKHSLAINAMSFGLSCIAICNCRNQEIFYASYNKN